MKKVLILGKDSYLGESLYSWLKKYPDSYEIDLAVTKDGEWKNKNFANFDTVVNFAGIAHINNITPDLEGLFFSVNRDLAVEMCTWAKEHGVKQFIQFSSMNVYGDYCGVVTDRTKTNPTSFYGRSKLEGDEGIHKLADENFTVASIRPPFVYGKGCKGNYNTVRKLALKLPVFPTYRNKKSMIYIDNLCEFIRLTIDAGVGGIFTPQNRELVSTSELVNEITKNNQHKILRTSIFNWAIPILMRIIGLAKKAFIDDSYCLELSDYYDWKYCVVSFEDSIKRTERASINE